MKRSPWITEDRYVVVTFADGTSNERYLRLRPWETEEFAATFVQQHLARVGIAVSDIQVKFENELT